MKRILLGLLLAAGAAHAETLVRSCATDPPGNGHDACPTMTTWERPPNAQWLNVNRRNVTEAIWIRAAELVATDRVYACTADGTTPGQTYAEGCRNAQGTVIRLPGRSDNWLTVSEITFTAPPPPSEAGTGWLRVRWQPVITDVEGLPFGGTAGYVVNRQQDVCSLTPPDPRCGNLPWVTEDVGTATVKTYEGLTGRWCFTVQGYTGTKEPGALSVQACGTPGRPSRTLPGVPVGLAIEAGEGAAPP